MRLHVRASIAGARRAPAALFRLLLLAALPALAPLPAAPQQDLRSLFFDVQSDDPGAWPDILRSIGMLPGGMLPGGGEARVYVVGSGGASGAAQWKRRMEAGAIVILEGDSELARAFGFVPTGKTLPVRNVVDTRAPRVSIIWERSLWLEIFATPPEARVLARERWQQAPLEAVLPLGKGGLLWLAVPPGVKGYERFPYLPQALAALGWEPALHSRRLWAFFDPSYRMRADLEYLAPLWRKAGIAALHVAAWHFFEPAEERDAYLRRLIAACHGNGILVYAWLGLPHVSEQFWARNPAWREQTALLQDAHLDWRKLMNLSHPDCHRAAAEGVRGLLGRFDWDGVNLAELYFESLEGHAAAARFTPMNSNVREEFRALEGFDPLELFRPESPLHASRNAAGLRAFLDYRAGLAAGMQQRWIAEMEALRRDAPDLELILTHVDDRFDESMRDLIGADAARLLPLLDRHDFTFLIEDPATLWHLGPERYTQLAERYRPLTAHPEKLAIDINIVERYQDVYPTKQQTGLELFQLVRTAAAAFPRVALYFENSILPVDRPFLAASAAVCERIERVGDKVALSSPRGLGINWKGGLRVDGRLWAATDGAVAWLPPGAHSLEAAPIEPPLRLVDFTGELDAATATPTGLELAYRSSSRAWAYLDAEPTRVEVDGVEEALSARRAGARWILALPRGQHLARIDVGKRRTAGTATE